MKVKELIDLLSEHPDFEVMCVFVDTSNCSYEHPWPEYHHFEVSGIADIGYSSKVILLETE